VRKRERERNFSQETDEPRWALSGADRMQSKSERYSRAAHVEWAGGGSKGRSDSKSKRMSGRHRQHGYDSVPQRGHARQGATMTAEQTHLETEAIKAVHCTTTGT